MRFLKTFLLISALTFFIAACAETATNNSLPSNNTNTAANNSAANAQPGATIDELASAREIYKNTCVRCHKEDGTGGEVDFDGKTINAEDFTTEKMKKMDDAKYVKYIENGVPDEGMPAFKDKLTGEQIRDMVKFIRAEFQK